jgi:pyridoxal phosphate enzyme (YggS family)
MVEIANNFKNIQTQILQSCGKVGRSPQEISFIAVTKGVIAEDILCAFHLGITHFGENRVQEAKIKISQLPKTLKWHMIGHLQTNKVRDAVQMFNMIQSVDSLRLAERICSIARETGKTVEVLLEVNIGKEPAKSGFLEHEVKNVFHKIRELEGLKARGLMTVAPYLSLEEVRPFFKKMKILFDQLEELDILSMGMSHDYSIAVEEGATMIRLGQALFGPRRI